MIILFWCLIALMILIALLFVVRKPFNKTALVLIVIIPCLSLGLYQQWGSSKLWFEWLSLQNLPNNLGTPDQVITEMKAHLKQNPNSAEGWYLLGRLYATQQHFPEAASAFAKANQLKPKQVDTLVNYAAALAMQQDTKQLSKISALLTEAITIDPNNAQALNLLAVTKYQQGKYQAAITLWEKLTAQFPPDTPDGQALLKAIELAQSKLK